MGRQVIKGFPPAIREVPEDPAAWLAWRKKVLAFRELCHRQADEDPEKRAALIKLAGESPAFFMAVFGVIHEPRNIVDMDLDADGNIIEMERPRGWYPWIPYPFQVRMINWIGDVKSRSNDRLGRGDGVVEKSRDVGGTWTFCLVAAHDWLFQDDTIIGLLSRKEALVDSSDPSSMFFKIRALLGLNRKIPEICHAPGTFFDGARVRLPDYLYPAGFEPKYHDLKLNLKHPTKTNQIVGEGTTSKSGIGSRTTWSLLDEGAKIPDLLDIWSGLGPVTDHRFVISSADRRDGDGMYILAEAGRAAQRNPTLEGPSLLSLPWDVIPLRDQNWYERTRARYISEGNLEGFAREYEINWNSGFGDWVYPLAQKIVPEDAPYSPTLGQVTGSIDPGIRDPTAVEMFQHIPGTPEYNLFDALVLQTPSAEYLAPVLMGWPPLHPIRDEYPDQGLQEFMDTMWEIRQQGYNVRWVGDPYGNNVGGANSDTYYTALWRRSRELNEQYPDLPPAQVTVMTKYDEGARYHRGRKEALTRMIPRIHFNNIPRVRHIVDALRNYRYKSADDARAVQNEPNTPLHDWSSHPTTAAEFFAVVATISDYIAGPKLSPVKSGRRGATRPPTPGYSRLR